MSGFTGVLDKPASRDGQVPLHRRQPAATPPRLRSLAEPDPYSGMVGAVRRALDERRLFVLMPVAVIAGLIASVAVASQPEPWALALVALVAAAALPLAMSRVVALRLLLLFMAFWMGFSLLAIHGALFGTTMLARPAYGTYDLHVDSIVSDGPSGRRIIVSAIEPVGRARALPIRRARIVVGSGTLVAPGDDIRGPVRFYPVPGPVVPGGFDTQFHAYFDGIGAYGNTTGTVDILRAGAAATPEHIIDDIRRAIGARIDRTLEQPAAGVARALITGDQSAVSQEARGSWRLRAWRTCWRFRACTFRSSPGVFSWRCAHSWHCP
jgi:competence protein ComEC